MMMMMMMMSRVRCCCSSNYCVMTTGRQTNHCDTQNAGSLKSQSPAVRHYATFSTRLVWSIQLALTTAASLYRAVGDNAPVCYDTAVSLQTVHSRLLTSTYMRSPDTVCRPTNALPPFYMYLPFFLSSPTPRARWTELNQNRPHAWKWVRFENVCSKPDISPPPKNWDPKPPFSGLSRNFNGLYLRNETFHT